MHGSEIRFLVLASIERDESEQTGAEDANNPKKVIGIPRRIVVQIVQNQWVLKGLEINVVQNYCEKSECSQDLQSAASPLHHVA